MPDTLTTITIETLKILVPIIVGFWGGSAYAEKIKNKVIYFTQEITFQTIAKSSASHHWGNIEVFWNGVKYSNVYLCSLVFSNNSSKNAPQNMIMQIGFEKGVTIHNFKGSIYIKETDTFIPLELETEFLKNHSDTINNYLALPPDKQDLKDIEYYLRTSVLSFPIFNRGNVATVDFLVSNNIDRMPVVKSFPKESGFSLVNVQTLDEKQRIKLISLIVVIIVSLLFIYPVVQYSTTKWQVVIFLLISGIASYPIGYGLVYILRNFRLIK